MTVFNALLSNLLILKATGVAQANPHYCNFAQLTVDMSQLLHEKLPGAFAATWSAWL